MVTPLSSSNGYWVPAPYADQLVQLVPRWGVTADQLLAGFGLTEETVQDPLGRLPMTCFAALIERARVLTGEPGLGFYLGMRKHITAYGYVGFAALSASSLREALEVVTRFSPVVTPSVSLRLEVEGRVACLVVEEHVDLGSARDVPLISLVFGMQHIARTLTGQDIHVDYVDLAIPEPSYYPRFRHLMPNARFDQPATQVVFDAAFLDLPLVQADRAALALAREHCERALDSLRCTGDAVVERVRQVVWRDGGGFHSLDEVAKCLGVSPRTLKRRLASQGASFTSLLTQERRRKATFLLEASRLPLEEVAARLGYSTLSNFARAFHQWTGRTPAAYRRARSLNMLESTSYDAASE